MQGFKPYLKAAGQICVIALILYQIKKKQANVWCKVFNVSYFTFSLKKKVHAVVEVK